MSCSVAKALFERVFARTLERIDLAPSLDRDLSMAPGCLRLGTHRLARSDRTRVHTIAIGKAAPAMAAAVGETLGETPGQRLIVTPTAHAPVPGFRSIHGRHPYPDAGSLDGARAALDIARGAAAEDILLVLLSGGGSSCCELPRTIALDLGIGEHDLAELYRALVGCGAPIAAINAVRARVSAIKGGGLAAAAAGPVLTAYVSDVPDGHPELLASGPTMPIPGLGATARTTLHRYGVWQRLPAATAERWRRVFDALDAEPTTVPHRSPTPSESPATFDPASRATHCVSDNRAARSAAAAALEAEGFAVADATTTDDLEDPDLATATAHILDALASQRTRHPHRPVAVVTGGELSCPVTGPGIGGRNASFALHAAVRIAGSDAAVFSAGTDGIDGNSPAAGAVVDGSTVARLRHAGMDPGRQLADSDAYTALAAIEDAVVTGPTKTNVRDLRIAIAPASDRLRADANH